MTKQKNNELMEFNNGKKNQKKIAKCSGYAFVSCPDFKHDGARYSYATGLGSGLPLYIGTALEELRRLEQDKPVHILLSDHELRYDDLLQAIGETQDTAEQKILGSLCDIQKKFSSTALLSKKYSYDAVLDLKPTVPRGRNFENELLHWGNEGITAEMLEERYLSKYAQVKAFMLFCQKSNLCAVFIYSIFIFKIVSLIRSEISIPVLFIENA